MSDSTAQQGVRRPGARRRHLGAHGPGPSCTWCHYLGARGLWELLALTCLPQLACRRSRTRLRPTARAR